MTLSHCFLQGSAVGVARPHGQAPPERGEGPMVTHPPLLNGPIVMALNACKFGKSQTKPKKTCFLRGAQ
jgi:hypothetical protein